MTINEKNFRSHYYEKVGFKGVEEKKSLDILLSDVPVDREKLQNFCIRFSVPGIYRNSVWKILLDIIPVYKTSQDTVWAHRKGQFEDLKKALALTRRLTSDTVTNITLVWLLNSNRLKYEFSRQLNELECESFKLIVSALCQILADDEEVFWVAQNLFKFLTPYTSDKMATMDALYKLLKDDTELLDHLQDYNLIQQISASYILTSTFSSVLQPHLLARLLDKVIGGSYTVLLYTLAAFFFTFRAEIIKMRTVTEIIDFLTNLNETDQEAVLSHGIDVWEQDGCPLVPGHHPEQPKAPTKGQEEHSLLNQRLSREIHVSM